MKKAGLYIHIPFCMQKCSYCDFFSVNSGSFLPYLKGKNGSPFARRLTEDIRLLAERYGIEEWDTVYMGGGTPSLLSEQDIDFIFSFILKHQKTPPEEVTIEVNPDDMSENRLKTAVSAGVNRISMGIQSFSDEVLRAEKRRGSCKKTLSALALVKQCKNVLLSCDLIAGLKAQTEKTVKNDIQTLLDFAPQHISFYALCTENPPKEEAADYIDSLWLTGARILEKNDYVSYEISNFSYKDSYKSLHNSKYWRLEDYAGVGPGAVGSMFFGRVADKPARAVRFSACKEVEKWLTVSDRDFVYGYESVSEKDLIEEAFMMNLRLCEGLDRRAFAKRFGRNIESLIGKTISQWTGAGRALTYGNFFKLSPEGLVFLNSFLQEAFREIEQTY